MSGQSGVGKPPDRTDSNQSVGPNTALFSTTSAWALGGGAGSEVRMRNFAEIIAEEKKQRNILEIHLVKKAATVENETFRPKSLTFDDLGELLFDVLNVDPSQCIGFNYSTGRYDTREVKFKPGVELTPYIRETFLYKDHEVSTRKQMRHATKVSFRNVPFSVPDEEIIQLCKCYGNPVNNKVHFEKMTNARNRGMVGSTRWVEMEFKSGCYMNNFYWLEGPLPGDTGSRITVLHSGQEQQCSHCLKTGSRGCRALGNGKACEQLMTPRAKMADYMADLRRTVGYESLKSQYLKQFPSLQAETTNNMEDLLDDESEEVLPSNPIELRDAKIIELEKNVAEMNDMKENLLKVKAELKFAVKAANIANAKVKFARNITEERLKECLPDPSFEDKHSQVIVALMSSLMDEDSFEIDPETDSLKPKENFLKDVEDSLDMYKEDQDVKQAGAELGQAQIRLDDIVEIAIEVVVKAEVKVEV